MTQRPAAPAPGFPVVPLPGARLACTVRGTGPVALLAHGITRSRAHEARYGLTDYAPVAAHHRLVAYDARGHGESGGRPEPATYAWDALAGDLLALADHFSPEAPVAAIGCSMGTATALHAALRAPERFFALVLTAVPTAWETRAAQAGLYRRMAALAADDPAALAALHAEAPAPPVFGGREQGGIDIRASLLPAVLEGAAASDLPAPGALARITVPTLVLAWDTDPGHPVSTAETVAAHLPKARLSVARTAAEIEDWGRVTADFLREARG
ncbi:alpha/beta fold hydrolase [Streptomyces sp. SPB074]|uniref:alpha/beta fold hydrolase n=1 Tax=Streptomyces sp. (strain SPB074) TaxID=465543 RepID=UPI0001D1DEBC|nr:alpha/beta fold hydrolase [Streptomyces sp. SPB074]EDY44535.2 alpha/beta hydrolase [Streptomyces sp. SPB074]